ncbi:MAG TPA: hypothetical protein VHR66_05040 [Gemmataceae bacterium]|jgi:hypothetical protein|nr:hypothetical protein [Gemmataceae bacterium]
MLGTREGIWLRWTVVGILAVTEICLVTCLLAGHTDNGPLIGTVIAVAALLVVTVRTSDVSAVAGGSARNRADLESLHERIDETIKRTSDLVRLVLPREEFQTLRKLSVRRFGPYAMGNGLERELRHLRQLGYVGVPSIGAIPRHGGELAEAVRVTPRGCALCGTARTTGTRRHRPARTSVMIGTAD